MPSNWASFINEANRNFGVGMNRYKQYSQMRDERLDRADAAAAFEAQKAATADQAVQTQEGFTAGFQPIDRSGWQSGPAITRTAVPTGEAATPSTGGAVTLPEGSAPLGPQEVPSRGAQGVELGMYNSGDTAKQVTDDYYSGAIEGLYPSAEPTPEGKGPVLKGKPVGGSERDAGDKKASSKKALEETIDWVVPRANKRAVSNATTEFVQGGTRQEHWDKMRDKLASIAVRNGDYEALMGLDEKITKMQQSKLQEHLTEAARLMGMGDKEGAANAMYQAYSYYPDGTDVEMRLDDTGRLIAYGYDEASGKFEGGQEMTADKIIGLLEHVKDPVAFNSAMRQRRLDQAATKEEQRRWEADHSIAKGELAIKQAAEQRAVENDGVARIKDRAQAGLYAAQALSENGAAYANLGWADPVDHFKYMETQRDWVNDALTDPNYPKGSVEAILYDPDGWVGANNILTLNDSISKNTLATQFMGAAEQKAIVEKLAAFEIRNGGFKGKNLEEDRAVLDVLKTDNIQFEQANSSNPYLVRALVNGREVVFNAATYPAILAKAKAGAPEKPTEAEAKTTTAPPPKSAVDPSAPTPGVISRAFKGGATRATDEANRLATFNNYGV